MKLWCHFSLVQYMYNCVQVQVWCMGAPAGEGGKSKQSPLENIYIFFFWYLVDSFDTFSPCEGLFATFVSYGGPFSPCGGISVTFSLCEGYFWLWGGSFLSLPPPYKNFYRRQWYDVSTNAMLCQRDHNTSKTICRYLMTILTKLHMLENNYNTADICYIDHQ